MLIFLRCIIVICVQVIVTSPVHAQIATDGSLGSQVSLNGRDVQVGEALGTRIGNNLFHSFHTFNVGTGGSATFTGSTGISNIISRVTGGEASIIEGLLRSEVGNADFFFLNPAGVTFGEGGSVDLPASFHLSTADELRFDNGTVFSSSLESNGSLSIATPESFGFLGNGTGSITVKDTQLFVGSPIDSQHSITVSASDLSFNSTEINAPNRVYIAAIGDEYADYNLESGSGGRLSGVLAVNGSIGNGPTPTDNILIEAGTVDIYDQGTLNSSSEGKLQLRSNTLSIVGGKVISRGSVEIDVSNDVIIRDGGEISSSSFGEGNAGNVTLRAGELEIRGGDSSASTGIFSNTFSSGNAGIVDVTATGLVELHNGGVIRSDTSGSGSAGSVFLTADELLIDSGDSGSLTEISSDVLGTGDGGLVGVLVMGSAVLQNGGQISSSTFAGGNAGTVVVRAKELSIDSDGTSSGGIFSNATSGSVGNAGIVDVTAAGLVQIHNGGAIRSDTSGSGTAGGVFLTADELLIDSGASASLTEISSDTLGSGHGGLVEVLVMGSAVLQNGSQISSSTFAQGNAGTVNVRAHELLIDAGGNSSGGILSKATSSSAGNAGAVDVTITKLALLRSGAQISSSTDGVGEAGSVELKSGELLIDGTGDRITGIYSDANKDYSGSAGTVKVTSTDTATLLDAGISSDTAGAGNAGNIEISAGELLVEGSTFSSDTLSTGNAGSVTIQVVGSAAMSHSAISSDTFGEGSAGNVMINARDLNMDIGTISTDTFSSGDAGSVQITTTGSTSLRQMLIDSESIGDGASGDIIVRANQLVVDDSLVTSSASGGIGVAGSIVLDAQEIEVRGGSIITSQATDSRDAGVIVFDAVGDVRLIEESVIFNGSTGTGSGGLVQILAGESIIIDGKSEIKTDTLESPAGPIFLEVPTGVVIISSGSVTTNTNSQSSNGGSINIDTNAIVLNGALILANAQSGRGGEIRIESNAVLPSSGQLDLQPLERVNSSNASRKNVIQSVAPTGVSVPPEIGAPEFDVSGSLSQLDTQLRETVRLPDNPCAALQTGASSSLVSGGRGALPATIDVSTDYLANLIDSNNDAEVWFVEQVASEMSKRESESKDAVGTEHIDQCSG